MGRGIPFVGRKKELDALNAEWRRGNSFVVIYGRRRVGKTALIKQFIQQKPALYFLASKESEALNRDRFAQQAAAFTANPLLASATFDDWRPIFQAIANEKLDEPYVLVIDEFPYLVSANKAMPSVMQYIWDEIIANTNAMLILCGSSVSMMRDEVLSRESPLYGRRTSQMRLGPLSFSEVAGAFPEASFESIMDIYTITGGIPKYLEFFNPNQSTQEAIRENVLSTTGYLLEEPEFLLSEETRGTVTNLSILRAVALGNRKVSEIARFLQRKSTDLSAYLTSLTMLGFLTRRVPFCEAYPDRSKNGLYAVSDAFMLFWLTYVQPFRGELELGNMQPSEEAMARTFHSQLVAQMFEQVSSQALAQLCSEHVLDFTPSRIGGYWNRTGTIELDVCAVDNTRGSVFLGECKYRQNKPVHLDDLASLEAKVPFVPGASDREQLLGLFSHTGFTDEVVNRAHDAGNIALIDKNRLVVHPD